MSDKSREILIALVHAAIPSDDGWIISVELNVKNRNELKEAVEELETLGCISKVNYHGWNRIQCKVDFDIANSYLE